MADIQKYMIKRGKRNAISRFRHEKKDNEVIATWMRSLDKIRRDFEVCFFVLTRRLLTFRFQTELAMKTAVNVSDSYDGVASTGVPEVFDTSNTHPTISQVHGGLANDRKDALKNRDNANCQNRPVSTTSF